MSTQHTATISHLSHDGRGIAHIDGKTIFIAGGLPQEKVEFRYLRRHSSFDEAEVTAILEASSERVAPQCPHFSICGGCSLQHLSPSLQQKHKADTFLELLQHQAGVQPSNRLPALTANPWAYRRKARLSAKFVFKKGKLLVGFREKKSHWVADIERCEILHPSIGLKITKIAATLAQLSIREEIPQLEIAVGDDVTGIIIRHLKAFSDADLTILRQFSDNEAIHLYLQPQGLDSIYLFHPQKANPLLSYRLKKFNLQFEFHPAQFVQVNAEINEQMVTLALQLLDLQKDDTVLDLFCGIGNFSLPLAQFAKQVIGLEGDNTAVLQAAQNAQLNHINNAKFYMANLASPPIEFPEKDWYFDKILLDPPRVGAKEIIDWVAGLHAKRIVYISCNPSTLARDTKNLCEHGYQLEAAGIMDMFPHTSHVESIAVFSKVL